MIGMYLHVWLIIIFYIFVGMFCFIFNFLFIVVFINLISRLICVVLVQVIFLNCLQPVSIHLKCLHMHGYHVSVC